LGTLTPYFKQWTDHPGKKINRKLRIKFNFRSKKLTDIYRAFHPKAVEYTFFSSAHGILSRIDHLIGHTTTLNNFLKI
jgi:exonuclease III